MKNISLILMVFFLLSVSLNAQNLQPTMIRVNNFELTYIEQGQGELLILLHGGLGDYRSWDAQMWAFSSKYRVISYSRRYSYPNRNILNSANYAPYYDDAEDLAGLLNKLKIKKATFVGTSAGAFTVLVFALKYPKMVHRLVLAEPPVHQIIRDTPDGEKVYQDFINSLWKPVAEAFGKNNDRQAMGVFYKGLLGRDLETLPSAGIDTIMQNAQAMKSLALSSEPFPKLSKDKLKELKIPILIITGENTIEIHKLVDQELARLIPDAEQATIPKAGHGSARENPEAFNEDVSKFFAGLKN